MECFACQSENRINAKFCRGCGVSLTAIDAPPAVALMADKCAPHAVALMEPVAISPTATKILDPQPFVVPPNSRLREAGRTAGRANYLVDHAARDTQFFSVWQFAPALAKSRFGDDAPAVPSTWDSAAVGNVVVGVETAGTSSAAAFLDSLSAVELHEALSAVELQETLGVAETQEPCSAVESHDTLSQLSEEDETRLAVEQLAAMLKPPVMETTRVLPTPVIPLVLAPPCFGAPPLGSDHRNSSLEIRKSQTLEHALDQIFAEHIQKSRLQENSAVSGSVSSPIIQSSPEIEAPPIVSSRSSKNHACHECGRPFQAEIFSRS